MNTPAAPRATLTSLALCLLLTVPLSACNPTPKGPDTAPGGGSAGNVAASLAAAPAPTRVTVRRVHGRLSESRRKAVRREVATVVEGWWDAAYLGGTYPRTGFRSAFPGFTRGARAQARRDQRLLSNRDIGARVESVKAERRRVQLDVLAVGRRAQAVTARFLLRFAVTGEAARTTVVRGRLFLTRRQGAWRVFGYDVAKAGRR